MRGTLTSVMVVVIVLFVLATTVGNSLGQSRAARGQEVANSGTGNSLQPHSTPAISSIAPATGSSDNMPVAPLASRWNVDLLSYRDYGPAVAIAVAGNYAFLGAGSWIIVLDVSNPAAPTMIGRYPLQSAVADGVVVGSYAYAVAHVGLYVLDVSYPANPTARGYRQLPGDAQGVVVDGNYAYVALGAGGLRILKRLEPRVPNRGRIPCYSRHCRQRRRGRPLCLRRRSRGRGTNRRCIKCLHACGGRSLQCAWSQQRRQGLGLLRVYRCRS